MYDILSRQSKDQANPVASLLIKIVNSIFSDLCTNTPWDKEGVINSARRETQNELLGMLKKFKDAMDKHESHQDEIFWGSFRFFEIKYCEILHRVNEWDKDLLKNNVLN